MGYRIGVDVGGTFTDVILQRSDGSATIRKLLSTPPNYDADAVAAYSFAQGPGESIPLEEYDFGSYNR